MVKLHLLQECYLKYSKLSRKEEKINKPVIGWVVRPQFDPVSQGMCIMLKEEPPVLNLLNSVLQGRPIPYRFMYVSRHKLRLLLCRQVEKFESRAERFVQYRLTYAMINNLRKEQRYTYIYYLDYEFSYRNTTQ